VPIIYADFKKKTAMEIKLSVEVPTWSITIHCAVQELIQERQARRYGKARWRTYLYQFSQEENEKEL